MKTCHRCNQPKLLTEFPKNKSKKDGVSETCLECKRAYNKVHYQNNKQQYLDKAAKRTKAMRNRLRAMKHEVGCLVCGEDHPACLDYHHRDPATKLFEVCDGLLTRSWKAIEAEIEKCDVYCSNCHRKLHYDDMPPGCAGSISPSEGEGNRFDSCRRY